MSDWTSVDDRQPDVFEVDVKLKDGSVIRNTWSQSDGDYYWKTPCGQNIYLWELSVTHWKPAEQTDEVDE